jgi:hypothetical protein
MDAGGVDSNVNRGLIWAARQAVLPGLDMVRERSPGVDCIISSDFPRWWCMVQGDESD